MPSSVRSQRRTHGEGGVGRCKFGVIPRHSGLSVRLRRTLRIVAPDEVMQLRGRHQARRDSPAPNRVQPLLQRLDQRRAGRTRIVTVDDCRGDGEINLGGRDDLVQGCDEGVGRGGVGELGRVGLP